MNIKDLYKLYSENFLVDTDTRKIRQNTIFFALKGENFNGNKFAENALELGASYAIVDEKKHKTSNRIILVKDVLHTLQKLANHHRRQLKTPIIALTGSNGKTTTKELINCVLSKGYKTTATIGNLNNHIGVPLTLLSFNKNTEIGIVEMGANHKNEIELLCSICEPDYGYITNFGKAHLEGFGSIEGVIEGKSELYSYLELNNKIAFINSNDLIQVEKTKNIKRVDFNSGIEFSGVNPFVKLTFNKLQIQSNLIGKYNFTNIAASVTIGKYFNISEQDIKNALENYFPNNNRSQVIETRFNKIILDAYNANPSSMAAALENFSMLKSKNKTVILGDMFELGQNCDEEHQEVADLARKLNIKNIFLVGEHFYKTNTEARQFVNFEELKKYLTINKLKNNSILIKGSRGMKLERVLEFLN